MFTLSQRARISLHLEVATVSLWATLLVKRGGKFNLETNKILFSQDVVFYGTKFPFLAHKNGKYEEERLIGNI